MTSSPPLLSIGQCATLACLLEVTAPKAGNVHRGADFEDLSFTDFAAAAVAIGPAMERAASNGVGPAVLAAVQATRALTGTNVNLGIALLMAPLAAVPREGPLKDGIARVLEQLSADDCRQVYEAIRLAQPGGLGRAEAMDVNDPAPDDLLAAMQLAADRDLIAQQYVTGFRLVLDEVLPRLLDGRTRGWDLATAIIHTHLQLLADHEDSLIVRKCGEATAKQVQTLAGLVLDAGQPGDEPYFEALADFDFWLRSDGHRRNPGTTADLIAAALFAGLRDNQIGPPF